MSTHQREADGRFSVQLPLRQDISKLGEYMYLKVHYVKFIQEYQASTQRLSLLTGWVKICYDSA